MFHNRQITLCQVILSSPFNSPSSSLSHIFCFFRNFKLTLLELERLYNLLIEVEDCEKKLLALPTNTSMRVQVQALSIKPFYQYITLAF